MLGEGKSTTASGNPGWSEGEGASRAICFSWALITEKVSTKRIAGEATAALGAEGMRVLSGSCRGRDLLVESDARSARPMVGWRGCSREATG